MIRNLFHKKSTIRGNSRIVHVGYPTGSSEIYETSEITRVKFQNNRVVTSKYTLINFIPKNLFEQFRRIANFCFLCIALVQLIIDSPVGAVTTIAPLLFVVVVTGIKQAYEDFLRHRADNDVNLRQIDIIRNGVKLTIDSQDIKVGDIVFVRKNESFPCDLVLLSSDSEDGNCYITTANLDGETNLKIHCSLAETNHLRNPEDFTFFRAIIECQHPNTELYKFIGKITINPDQGPRVSQVLQECSLGQENVLLTGSCLKNTTHIYGAAVYTGQETKMALNSKMTSNKFSTVEKTLNAYLILYLIILLLEVALCTILQYVYRDTLTESIPWFDIEAHKQSIDITGRAVVGDMLSYLILFSYIIPISMYVTIEMQKFLGSLFFATDELLYDPVTDQRAKCNSSDLNEELGQVEYLFTDKTGTLTENDLQFRQCSINAKRYVEHDGNLCKVPLDSAFEPQPVGHYDDDILQFLLCLALCHTAHVSLDSTIASDKPEAQDLIYEASSPDEKALLDAAKRFGVIFLGMRGDKCSISFQGKLEIYQRLHVLEFDSDRKCMSVIVRDPEGRIYVLTKGAEQSILDRCNAGPKNDATLQHVNEYATLGLRTLAISKREIDDEELKNFDTQMREARTSMTDREEKLSEVFNSIETNLTLLGATAIEDRLQDGVKETLVSLRQAGIKIWVLTGDKLETAVNISNSCGLIDRDMRMLKLSEQNTSAECYDNLEALSTELVNAKNNNEDCVLVMDGRSLVFALADYSDLLYQLSSQCISVVCCRVSPLQKAMVVRLVKCSVEKPITAAIGDGANDVSMIQEAHVGLGVMGKEGRQAVRCADFAFARFRFLLRVLLIHGHYYYVRVSTLVQYFFYKNIAFITSQMLYTFYTGHSDQPLYDSTLLTFYNTLYTALPILIYGLFEQNIPQRRLHDEPELYKQNRKNAKLRPKEFGIWNASGLWHCIVFFYGTMLLYNSEGSLHKDGTVFGQTVFGTFIGHICIITVNLKLALETRYFTWIFAFSILVTLIGFMGLNMLFSGIIWIDFSGSTNFYWTYFELLASASIWATSFLFIVTALMPDMLVAILRQQNIPSLKQKLEIPLRKIKNKWRQNSSSTSL